MTDGDRKKLDGALAQARATQAVLTGLLLAMKGRGDYVMVYKEAFDLAAESFTILAMNKDPAIAADAALALKGVDDMRRTAIGD